MHGSLTRRLLAMIAVGWRVGFDGEARFASLSSDAPVVTAQERRLFAQHGGQVSVQANGDYRTGMRLPYAVGQS